MRKTADHRQYADTDAHHTKASLLIGDGSNCRNGLCLCQRGHTTAGHASAWRTVPLFLAAGNGGGNGSELSGSRGDDSSGFGVHQRTLSGEHYHSTACSSSTLERELFYEPVSKTCGIYSNRIYFPLPNQSGMPVTGRYPQKRSGSGIWLRVPEHLQFQPAIPKSHRLFSYRIPKKNAYIFKIAMEYFGYSNDSIFFWNMQYSVWNISQSKLNFVKGNKKVNCFFAFFVDFFVADVL